MKIRFATPEWARALVEEINESSEYRNAGRDWGVGMNGNVLLVFEADAQRSRPASLLIRLSGGACQGAEFGEGSEHPDAAFALRAPFSLWKDILERKTMAATAILTGRMAVSGNKLTLLKHTAAHRALITCAAAVETEFA